MRQRVTPGIATTHHLSEHHSFLVRKMGKARPIASLMKGLTSPRKQMHCVFAIAVCHPRRPVKFKAAAVPVSIRDPILSYLR
jgi:hypothetical protein